ncbi:MAG TPA: hypothetical protein PKX16_07525, partial [Kiritimatiellia bacterium]|nr:hypothetical protein [Kiritimatiellia bacterium]
MADTPWSTCGPWRFLIAPGWDRPGFPEVLAQLSFLLEKQSAPLAIPGRNRVDRLALPWGDDSLDAVVKTYGLQSAGRDRLAARSGSKAWRAFQTASLLRAAG